MSHVLIHDGRGCYFAGAYRAPHFCGRLKPALRRRRDRGQVDFQIGVRGKVVALNRRKGIALNINMSSALSGFAIGVSITFAIGATTGSNAAWPIPDYRPG